ncbi:MAG: hypothetical protein IID38_03175, partial [Planctomycetes bacterium]|nr:hypothetical protein [Planctomycetota bacterium]
YRLAATFQIFDHDPENASTRVARYRRELLEYAAKQFTAPSALRSHQWWVDAPGDVQLRLSWIASNRPAAVDRLRGIARGYLSHLDARAAEERARPTEAEEVLFDYISRLEARVAQAIARDRTLQSSLPENDPTGIRANLLGRWNARRREFDDTRLRLTEAREHLKLLKAEPEPTVGLVTSEERRQALEEDLALQQDLAEQHVTLTELKLHLLNVWQASSGPLERLGAGTDELLRILQSMNAVIPTADAASPSVELLDLTRAYREFLVNFATAWTREFKALQGLTPDPASGELLDAYQRIRIGLRDFAFTASKQRSAMRASFHAVGASQSDTARHHVLHSRLARAFHGVQTTQHRFEFAAAGMETQANFRLDAAVTSAQGLRQRMQKRIRSIERRLHAAAVKRARRQQREQIAGAGRQLEKSYVEFDDAVARLVGLQEELNLSADRSEVFARSLNQMEVARTRLQLAQADLNDVRGRLDDLQSQRRSPDPRDRVELLSCGVLDGPANFHDRIRRGALAAALTLLTVFLAQCWIIRRR